MFAKILSFSKTKKVIPVLVHTMDAQLEFEIDKNSLGRDLFDLVTRAIGRIYYLLLNYFLIIFFPPNQSRSTRSLVFWFTIH